MLIFDDQFLVKIVVSGYPTKMDLYAANELKKYLDLISGEEIEIISEHLTKENEGYIYVGKVKSLIDELGEVYNALQQDSFAIITTENALYIFGRETVYSQSATLYGVYDFLERAFGVKFYSYDEEYVPNLSKMEIDEYEIIERPAFEVRQPLYGSTRRHPEFTAKCRIKDCYCRNVPGGSLKPAWGTGLGHNYFELIPPKEYAETHPEWFDLDKEHWQLCFSREDLTDELIKKMKTLIINNPYSKYFALSQEDTVCPCQCEKCKENYKKYGSTGTMIRFVNRVAEKIGQWVDETYPGREVYLVAFAYYFTLEPPVRKVGKDKYEPYDKSCIPADNVYIFFTTIDCCYYHDFCDTNCEWNKEFYDRFMGWKSVVGERLFVWNYAANYKHYLYPFWNFKTMANNYRFFHTHSVKHLLDHGPCETEFVEFAELRTYVSSKLMWNPNLDTKVLMKDFVKGYYKEAAEEVWEYLQLLEENFARVDRETGYHLRLYHLPDEMFDAENFPHEFLLKLFSTLDKALTKVETAYQGEELVKMTKRILRIRVSAKFLLLMNYASYGLDGKETFVKEFIADCERCDIQIHREARKRNLDELEERALNDGVIIRGLSTEIFSAIPEK